MIAAGDAVRITLDAKRYFADDHGVMRNPYNKIGLLVGRVRPDKDYFRVALECRERPIVLHVSEFKAVLAGTESQ